MPRFGICNGITFAESGECPRSRSTHGLHHGCPRIVIDALCMCSPVNLIGSSTSRILRALGAASTHLAQPSIRRTSARGHRDLRETDMASSDVRKKPADGC
jgi:hypothetical protein